MRSQKQLISVVNVILVAVLLLSLFAGCSSKRRKNPLAIYLEHEFQEPVRLSNGNVFFCNRFRSVGAAPFALPDKTPDSTFDGLYTYENFSLKEYNDYLTRLENAGFECVRLKYEAFCRKDDCLICLHYPKDGRPLELYWYARSEYAPDGGMSEHEAAVLLCPEHSLSKVPLTPVDITPEGFFERTGGQIFAVPVYSYDIYDTYPEDKKEDLMFEDNENYTYQTVFVWDNKPYYTDYQCIASADIDNDGVEEICLLRFGGTSGVFSFVLEVVPRTGNTYSDGFTTEYYYLSFSEKDGKLVVHGETYNGDQYDFDIVTESRSGVKTVTLEHDGKELQR